MKKLFEHANAFWTRYAAYAWRKAADGKEYLLPTADAEAAAYNMMDVADQLVLDAVNVGLLVMHKEPKETIQTAIYRFVCSYGLLGMMTALPTTPNFVEYEKVYLLKNQFIRQEAMDTLDYMKLFFPFDTPDFCKCGIASVWNISDENRAEAALSMTFRNDPQAKAMSFMRSYGEPYEWMQEVFLDLAFTFTSSFLYYQERDTSDAHTLDLYRKGLACFEGNAPTYHLALEEHPVIAWDFHSLMLAVKFLFSVRLTDAKNPVRLCEHCGKAFYALRTDSRFCSAECRNKARKKS